MFSIKKLIVYFLLSLIVLFFILYFVYNFFHTPISQDKTQYEILVPNKEIEKDFRDKQIEAFFPIRKIETDVCIGETETLADTIEVKKYVPEETSHDFIFQEESLKQQENSKIFILDSAGEQKCIGSCFSDFLEIKIDYRYQYDEVLNTNLEKDSRSKYMHVLEYIGSKLYEMSINIFLEIDPVLGIFSVAVCTLFFLCKIKQNLSVFTEKNNLDI